MNPTVSVIITAYNEEKYIGKCLQSLLLQVYKPLEIIVVDDGSNDNTIEIIRRIISTTKQIILFKLKHNGTAISRNFAAQKAKGDILIFLDADMEFEPDFISKLTSPICEKITKGTFSKLEYVKNWKKPIARCWNWNNNPPLPDKLRVTQDKEIGEDFRAILKSEFIRVNGFNNIGYTDTWSLAKKLGYKPINAPQAIYYHNNPETYQEVFNASVWIGKREYKMGKLGNFINVFRHFIIFSFVNGIIKAIKYREPQFVAFQIVYDLGITYGSMQKVLSNNVIK